MTTIHSRHTGAAAILAMLFAAPAFPATLAVGPGKTYAAPCAAIAQSAPNDVIEITGGVTYSGNVCAINTSNLTIRGVNGRPRIDAAGANAQGKGTWVVTGNNVTIENVEMLGARVPDQNGAALRLEGTHFTLRGSFIHDNENGILSGANTASNILIENNEFGHNGYGTGYTHNVYIGNVASLTFRANYSHDANVGHNLKSRARVNTVAYNRFSSTPDGQTGSTARGKPSYEIDLPNAGTGYVIGNVIEQPAGNSNPNMLAYGEEGASNPAQDLYVVNNTFLNDDPNSGTFVMVGTGVTRPVLIQNNIFAGTGTLSNQAGALERTNFRSIAPGFVDRAGYDLHPSANVLVIDAGSAPGLAASGLSLAPVAQYKHVAAGETRTASGAFDIGAYEASAAPAAGGGWTSCAVEGGTCSFSGTAQVRYGANNVYATRTASGSIACTNAVFGDPIQNVAKTCQYAATAATPTPPAVETWTPCAAEGASCAFSGTRTVRYGAVGVYVARVATASTPCTNAVFGDPVLGTAKSCSYSSITR
ncbi:right-handed parallel beta-helix repeat-containing protein [Massilia sp. S19_KUP03_FR1]|uniref:right-handed parallel beta-helix repeat-containing protein n=1 Tax=Massilia sp. S19_KUP03_FR1 TaxID=3025503 RepID=UPI002FCCC99B